MKNTKFKKLRTNIQHFERSNAIRKKLKKSTKYWSSIKFKNFKNRFWVKTDFEKKKIEKFHFEYEVYNQTSSKKIKQN